MTTDLDYSHLVGHPFPGGLYTLAPYEAWLWDDAVMSSHDVEVAHPGIAYMVGLHGGGASIQDIMDLLGTSNDSGVMMGSVEFDLHGAIKPGATYAVEGEITSLERRTSQRIGEFDLVGFEHRLTPFDQYEQLSDRGAVAVVRHIWIIPRGAL